MKDKQHFPLRRAGIASLVAISFVLTIHFSCQENEADETPVNPSTIVSAETDNASSTAIGKKKFHDRVGSLIPIDVAMRWKAAYKKENPNHVESHFFGNAIFQRLLSQPGVAGISIEYALNDDGVPQLLLVGVDTNGKKLKGESELGYGDASIICPPDCSFN